MACMYMYNMYKCAVFMLTPPFTSCYPIPLYTCQPFFFTYLENQLLLHVVRIPIHSCTWFAINCSPLAASPTQRHPTDQVTYLHRRHQQHQPSRLIQLGLNDRNRNRGLSSSAMRKRKFINVIKVITDCTVRKINETLYPIERIQQLKMI